MGVLGGAQERGWGAVWWGREGGQGLPRLSPHPHWTVLILHLRIIG